MRIIPGLAVLAGLVMTLRPVGVAAQGTAPVVLTLPGAVRGQGLGHAYVAGASSDMVYTNPAQIGVRTGYALSGGRIGSGATLATFASSTTVGGFGVAVGVAYLDYSTVQGGGVVTPWNLGVDGPQAASSIAGTAAVSRRLYGVRAGVAFRYGVEQRSGRSGRVSVDLGVAREVGPVTVAAAAQHLGGEVTLNAMPVDQPRRVSIGAMTRTVPLGVWFDLVASGSVTWERHRDLSPAAGVEVTYVPVVGWAFSGRIGVRAVDGTRDPSQHPLTLGASFGIDRLSVDYAFEPVRGDGVGSFHRVGIRLQ